MIDANRGTSEEALRRLKAASYERFHIELITAIERLLDDFQMTWDDLAVRLCADPEWVVNTLQGSNLKSYVGGFPLPLNELNAIAHIFSAEPYIIFRPRFPYTQS